MKALMAFIVEMLKCLEVSWLSKFCVFVFIPQKTNKYKTKSFD